MEPGKPLFKELLTRVAHTSSIEEDNFTQCGLLGKRSWGHRMASSTARVIVTAALALGATAPKGCDGANRETMEPWGYSSSAHTGKRQLCTRTEKQTRMGVAWVILAIPVAQTTSDVAAASIAFAQSHESLRLLMYELLVGDVQA